MISQIATCVVDGCKVELYNYTVNKGNIYAFMSFDLKGGTFSDPSAVNPRVDITNGPKTVALPSVDNKVGYTFNGWVLTDADGTTVIPLGQDPSEPLEAVIAKDAKLEAQWTPISELIVLHVGNNVYCSNGCPYTYDQDFTIESYLCIIW